MESILTLSIGIGLVTSLMFSELLGVAAGGMIVPGYIALHLDNPSTILLTLFISWLTYFTVHSLSTVMIIYGRRKTVMMLLVGFMFGYFVKMIGYVEFQNASLDLTVVGYIIPGLIAIWIERQGLVETFSALITSSIIVRLILIVITDGELAL